ncbi:MAG TPA: hypothetical protein VLH85_02405 [Levilinea sp.]|nr:hypothetical protein [Levilinea sp.]
MTFRSFPLAAILGIKPGTRLLIINPPEDYPATLGALPPDVSFAHDLKMPLDFIQYFTRSRADLEKALPALKSIMAIDGMIWICWPMAASGLPTDLHEEAVRETGLHNGLADVKIVAMGNNWSACKFMYRLEEHSRP